MPATTSYRPCLAVSLHCRHRLGSTDGGASPVRNEYRSLSHTTRPSSALTTHGVSAAMKPRSASAKSAVSSSGSRRFGCADAIAAVGALWFTGQTLPLLHPCWKRQIGKHYRGSPTFKRSRLLTSLFAAQEYDRQISVKAGSGLLNRELNFCSIRYPRFQQSCILPKRSVSVDGPPQQQRRTG